MVKRRIANQAVTDYALKCLNEGLLYSDAAQKVEARFGCCLRTAYRHLARATAKIEESIDERRDQYRRLLIQMTEERITEAQRVMSETDDERTRLTAISSIREDAKELAKLTGGYTPDTHIVHNTQDIQIDYDALDAKLEQNAQNTQDETVDE